MSEDQRPPDDSTETDGKSTPDAAREGAQEQADIVTGKRLGDFELLRELGRGGMGVVYEARQVSLNRRIALKVLPPGLGLTDTAVQRFGREARAAAGLHHTNIVPVYAIGEEEGSHFYVMELIEGEPLSRILNDLRGQHSSPLLEAAVTQTAAASPDKKGKEPSSTISGTTSLSDTSSSSREWFDTVARLLADVADALQYAHGRGVIHRDVKPANLMLSNDGRLCLTDFGLARVAQEPGMTVSGSFLGTPAYMSPEQIAAGRVQVDHRSDIYSLGAVLYEMLSLRRPFTGESRDEILNGIMTKDPRPPRRFNSRIPIDLETICQKAMEKDRDRRYQSAAEFASDLRQFLQRGLITARRAGLPRRTWKSIRRHPVAATVMVAVVVLAATISGVTFILSEQRTREAARRAVSDARLYLARGEYRQGLKSVDEALDLLPGLEEGRIIRARLLIKINRAPEAVEEARAVLETNPDDWTAHLVLAIAAKNRSAVDIVYGISVEEHLAVVKQNAPDSADAYFLRALMAETAAEAVTLLDRALETDPSHADALFERSLRHEELKNFPAALLDGERLAAMRPRSAEGHRIIAWLHSRLHDPERALQEFDRALQLNPDDILTYAHRSTVYESLGRYEEQVEDLTRALQIDPQYVYGYVLRALAYITLGRHDEALKDAHRALELQPDLPYPYVAIGNVLIARGKRSEVGELIARVREATRNWTGNDQQAELHVLLSQGYIFLGDYEQALRDADRAVALLPEKHRAYTNRARIHRMMGNTGAFDEDCAAAAALPLAEPAELSSRAGSLADTCLRRDLAIHDYDKALELAPWWADLYQRRATVYKDDKRFEESLADLDRAIELAPAWSGAYSSRAQVLSDLDRFDAAFADTDRYLELGDDGHRVRWLRANLLISLGREQEALANIDRIEELRPESNLGHLYRGHVLFMLGRVTDAIAELDRALEMNPTDGSAYSARGEFRASLPEWCDESVDDLRQFGELGGAQLPWVKLQLSSTHTIFLAHHCPEVYRADQALELAESAYRQQLSSYAKQIYGYALYRNGRYAEARDALDEGLREEVTEWPPTLAFLAMTHHRLGNVEEARLYYDRAVARIRKLNFPRYPMNTLLLDEAARLLGVQPQEEIAKSEKTD